MTPTAARLDDPVQPDVSVRRFLLTALLAFVCVLLPVLAFAVTTPLFAQPDEPQHYVKSYAVVTGQADATSVTIPRWLADASAQTCFAFDGNLTASCQRLPKRIDESAVETTSMYAGYDPVYYAIVGWPLVLLKGIPALYAVRIASAVVSAALLALAFSVTRHATRSVWATIGFVVTLAPQTLFLLGGVNPNNAEIAAAALLWTALAATFASARDGRPGGRALYLVLATAALAILLPLRIFSPLWGLLIVVASLLAARWGWSDLVRFFRGLRPLVCVAVIAASAGYAVWWIVSHPGATGATVPITWDGSVYQTLRGILLDFPASALLQSFGSLGWLDTPITWAPFVFVALWVVLGALVVREVRSARRRWTIVAVGVLSVVLPSAFEGIFWGGVGWQGRYTLPFLIGVPLLAGFALDADRVSAGRRGRRGLIWMPAAVVATAVLALVVNYHRYAAGYDAPWGSAADVWHGPLPFAVCALGALVGLVGLSALALGRPAPIGGPIPPHAEHVPGGGR
ncbi:DUF2142 domain-containing protein [Galbitalea sp. SE-J8]|uniref:DUF2142 domain-containing protein n=1 Tax=Galbitalea sp. SE-J8 TaxID=3054952 RepID=UPI00259C70F5|nr:DUF2142 domain-containing protein [Galbitalea sp. SE-J8]MDM4762949.1 DUF2142 domain-containing protein [Galbitalea sp. SE-J8]